MKNLDGILTILIALVIILIALSMLYFLFTGFYLAFSASVILGLCTLLFFPLAFFSGAIYFFSNADVMQKIAEALGLS